LAAGPYLLCRYMNPRAAIKAPAKISQSETLARIVLSRRDMLVAQTADQHTAARLLSGLAREFPCRNERVEIAELHFRAIDSFFELATALKNETGSRPHDLWKRAVDAVTAWLQAVSICKAFPVGPRLIFPGVATAAQPETVDDVSHSTAGGAPTRKQDS
jgi:hypothetical protein